MNLQQLIILSLITFFASNVAFGQEATSGIMSIPQRIGDFIGGASPFILIGLGILLIFIQKLAKYIGIFLLIIGVVRIIFLFIH
ncbi:MAG: hypothetical protein AYP45_02145 [Candidatus Brocadia carolinensis]|uniref:Uncharacterized protein n=1 Tax=Candidatus Brocadia carolinensis TaxID=1004156 RepID=A0A1V4AX27_9BACT|nr:MAG: hypothetical protein AYP45_02145 [Candidatus Brocadia caroliniensis]